MCDLISILQHALQPDYQVIRYLDIGGQGALFLGQYVGVDIAIKIYDPTTTDERRVDHEIEFLRNADHPNLVNVIGVERVVVAGVSCPVIAYEYIPGGDLRQLIGNNNCLTFDEIGRIGNEIGSAIEYMWASRVVHRDIKPGNVLMTHSSHYVLCDLGFAKHLDKSGVTMPGFTVGTRGYMSPEQYAGRKHLTIHSDIFGLGILLYELAAQNHPFDRSQVKIGRIVPEDLAIVRNDLPRTFCSLIHEMMAPSPGSRPSSVSHRIGEILEV